MTAQRCPDPDCGLSYNSDTFRRVPEPPNRTFLVCPNEHKNELVKISEHELGYKFSYPFKPLQQTGLPFRWQMTPSGDYWILTNKA